MFTEYKQAVNESDLPKILGIKFPKKPISLGSGSYGTAYALNKTHILKITNCRDEAEMSAYLTGKKLTGVWNIYGVWQTPDWKDRGWRGECWGIVGERLESDEDKSYKILRKVEDIIPNFDKHSYHFDFETTERALRKTKDKKVQYLIKGLHNLWAYGVGCDDVHSENVLWKNGMPKIIDLRGHYFD